MKGDVLVILPTYNESANIGAMIGHITGYGAHVLVVDDNSPDGTAAVVKALAKDNPGVALLSRPAKSGLGSAYIDGFRYALLKNYKFVFTMDADLSHPHEKIPELLALGTDFAVGSRYVKAGKVVGWPLHRRLLSRYANIYARTMLRMPVKDLTSGFNCIKASILPGIDFETIQSEGYGFLIELKLRAWKKGYSVKETPIVFTERKFGSSKLGKKIIIEALIMILKRSVGLP